MVDRFKKFKLNNQDYFFDKAIFTIMFIVIFVLFDFIIFSVGNVNAIHIKCDDKINFCENPLYQNYRYVDGYNIPSYLFDQEFLSPGFEINKPPFIVNYFDSLLLFIVVVCLLINHFVYNRNFVFKNIFDDVDNIMEEKK